MITEKHKAFAQAVVALARKHAVDGIDQFRFHTREGRGERITFQWYCGRHNAEGMIRMSTEAKEEIQEQRQ